MSIPRDVELELLVAEQRLREAVAEPFFALGLDRVAVRAMTRTLQAIARRAAGGYTTGPKLRRETYVGWIKSEHKRSHGKPLAS